jgi:predicted esterase YcpF (UPF0227 family)
MPTTPPTTHILYLHGFRSSPQSVKARQMAALVAGRFPNVTWWCPQLPPSPRKAMELLMNGIQTWPQATMAVVGSSLGGFYATAVAAQTGCKAVLLNPAVNPARDLEKYIGEQTSWHDPQERFFFLPEFVDELRAITQTTAQPKATSLTQLERTFAVIAKDDEVLDWKEMHARYAGAHIKLLEGGDHALSDFDDHVDEVLAFLNLR